MKSFVRASCGLLAIGMALGIASASAQDVAAKVGNKDISLEEAKAMIATLPEREQAAVKSSAALLSQTLRVMLLNQLALKEANEKKWADQPNVKAQIERLRETAIVESYLQSVSQPPANFPSDAEVQAFYNANAQAFYAPRMYQVADILIAAPKTADQATKDAAAKKLAEVEGKLKAGGDFAATAKSYSDDKTTAERGGELGWIPENYVRPELLEKLSTLNKGGVTPAIQLDDGWHIVKLLDTKSAGPLPVADVKAQIALRLRQERAVELRRAYLTQLAQKNPMVINELALSKLVTVAGQGANSDAGAGASGAAGAATAAKPTQAQAPAAAKKK